MLKLIVKLLSRIVDGNAAIILLYLVVIGMYAMNLLRHYKYTQKFGPCIYKGRMRFNKKVFYAIFVLVMAIWIIQNATFMGIELVLMMTLSGILFIMILMTSLDVPRIYEKIIFIDHDYHLLKNVMTYEFKAHEKEDQYLLKLKIRFDANNIPYEEYRSFKVEYEQFHKLKTLFESHRIQEV